MDLVHNMASPEGEKYTVCLSVHQGPEFSVVGVERGMCSFPEEKDKENENQTWSGSAVEAWSLSSLSELGQDVSVAILRVVTLTVT